MLIAMLIGCSDQTEIYEDFHTDLYETCSISEDECDEHLKEMFNDDEGISLVGMKWLIFEASPWFTNLIAGNVDTITTDCNVKKGAIADYSSYFNKICIGYTKIMNTGISGAGVLVHEAGHGRPPGRQAHTECLIGKYAGKTACDSDLKGAVGAELFYWENMTELEEPYRSVALDKVDQMNSLIIH